MRNNSTGIRLQINAIKYKRMTLTKNVSDIQTLLPKRIAIKVWLRALQSTISSPAKEWETEIAIQKI